VLPVPAPPIRMAHEMGAGLQEDLDDTGACDYFLSCGTSIRNFPMTQVLLSSNKSRITTRKINFLQPLDSWTKNFLAAEPLFHRPVARVKRKFLS